MGHFQRDPADARYPVRLVDAVDSVLVEILILIIYRPIIYLPAKDARFLCP